MKNISEYFEKPMFNTVVVASSEWNELIGIICDKINAGRVGTIYKPVTPGMIVKKVKGFKTNDLRDFVKECDKTTCFSKCFYGKLKKK